MSGQRSADALASSLPPLPCFPCSPPSVPCPSAHRLLSAPPGWPSPRSAKRFHLASIVQPLGSAACGAFKVHQFCGGFNQEAAALYDLLHEQTIHYARMLDPKWLRSSKLVR